MEFTDFTNIAQSLTAAITGDPYYTYYWVSLLIGGLAFLALFLLEGFALNKIAKNNGFKNRWMAFVPFLNTYYIGVLAEKNKTFNTKTKYYSFALAILEAINFVLFILYSVAIFALFNTTYIRAIPEPFYNAADELVGYLFTGNYEVVGLPESLNWAWWVFKNVNNYFISIIDLAHIVISVFVLSAFFRTYSPRNYMVFTIFSVLLPIKAVFMFCVRNKNAVSYVDYVKDMQRRQYDAYQQYMRNNGGYNNGGYNNGGYNNGNNGGYNNGGYNNGGYNNGGGQGNASQPDDPFGGLGEQSNRGGNPPADDDPFGDLK